MSETSGVGSNVVVKVEDLGPGWVCIRIAEGIPDPSQMTRLLQDALQRWCQARPHYRIRTALPIQAQGSTCAIHLWWEVVPEAAALLRQTQAATPREAGVSGEPAK